MNGGSLSVNGKAVTAAVLCRDPAGVQMLDGSVFVASTALEWHPVPVVADPRDCEHGLQMCGECGNSWAIDHYLRIYEDGVLVWQSPDLPVGPDEPAAD